MKRNIGVALGHCVLGYKSCLRGLQKVSPNEKKLKKDLLEHAEVITEGIQTVLRVNGQTDAYEKLKDFSKGKHITLESIHHFIKSLRVDALVEKELLALTPVSYVGLAEKIVRRGILTVKKH